MGRSIDNANASAAPDRSHLKRNRLPYRLLLRGAPLHAFRVVQYELRMARVRLANPSMARGLDGSSGLMVNVGCGRNGLAGWVNVDSAPGPHVTSVYDCRRHLPLPTGTARAIFTEHLFEHLDYAEEAPAFLAECHRVLEAGGILRIIVPDGRKYLLAYAEGGWQALRDFSPLLKDGNSGFRTPMEVVNSHFRQGGQHRFSYDYDTLRLLLERSGFDDIRECRFGDSRLPGLAIDNAHRADESLYVEAVRLSKVLR